MSGAQGPRRAAQEHGRSAMRASQGRTGAPQCAQGPHRNAGAPQCAQGRVAKGRPGAPQCAQGPQRHTGAPHCAHPNATQERGRSAMRAGTARPHRNAGAPQCAAEDAHCPATRAKSCKRVAMRQELQTRCSGRVSNAGNASLPSLILETFGLAFFLLRQKAPGLVVGEGLTLSSSALECPERSPDRPSVSLPL